MWRMTIGPDEKKLVQAENRLKKHASAFAMNAKAYPERRKRIHLQAPCAKIAMAPAQPSAPFHTDGVIEYYRAVNVWITSYRDTALPPPRKCRLMEMWLSARMVPRALKGTGSTSRLR